ncbi:hypothetical protein TWF481_004561 [Arthrobotrys musiformis]|uniref:Uncharacterized protein n=1 Tax=Arthrobotrys musiformis TaxID=47236 RepID=A0AAV9WJW5_9PEZI
MGSVFTEDFRSRMIPKRKKYISRSVKFAFRLFQGLYKFYKKIFVKGSFFYRLHVYQILTPAQRNLEDKVPPPSALSHRN